MGCKTEPFSKKITKNFFEEVSEWRIYLKMNSLI